MLGTVLPLHAGARDALETDAGERIQAPLTSIPASPIEYPVRSGILNNIRIQSHTVEKGNVRWKLNS